MSQVKSIFMNTSWLSISQVVKSVCAFLWTILIARYLGVSQYGIVSFAISFSGLLMIFVDFGMTTYMTREIAKRKELVYKFMNNMLSFKIILSVLIFFISGLILALLKYPPLTIAVTLIFTIEMIAISMTSFFNGIFQAFEQLKYQAIGTILNSGFLLVGVLLTMFLDWGIISIAVSYVIAYLAFVLYMFIKYVQWFSYPKLELDLSFIRRSLISSLPFGLTDLFYTIYFSIDVVMLSYLAGNYSTGLYNSAYNIIAVFTTFFPVYQHVIFPVMSKFFKESKDLIKVSYELSVKYLLLVILPLSVGIFLYARPVVDLVYSNQYSLASTPMQILIWTVSFLFVNGAAATLLNAVDREKTVTKIYIAASIFNVALNLLLIPVYSYDGAAIATVLSEVLITVLTLYHVFKTDFKPDIGLLKTVIKLIIASVLLGAILYWINVSLWLAIPIGLVVYIALLFVTRVIDDNDRYIISELIRN